MFDDHTRVRASDILESDKWKLLSEMKSHEEKKEKKLLKFKISRRVTIGAKEREGSDKSG